ncbi:MAG: hypothetical protein JXR83_14355 [Deltaproteobacteria bacterium]|nr:hypothetical protein [Deltaproteobacteria bacterium]
MRSATRRGLAAALAGAVAAALAVWGGRALLLERGHDLDAVIAAADRQDFAAAEQLLQELQLDRDRAGAALAAQGYLASSRGDSTAALQLYQRAFEAEAAIASHPAIVDDVVASLTDQPAAAAAILAHCDPATARSGLRRSVADPGLGYAGRLVAARLLVERGHHQRAPVRDLAREVLSRSGDCQQRKLAVQLLGEVGDRSDLDRLAALDGDGDGDRDGGAPGDGPDLLARIGKQLQRSARDLCLGDAPRQAMARIRDR